VVLLIAALWTPVAVPALVKFPMSTNVHVLYSGSFASYVNPKTGAVLASPSVAKLAINQHLQAIPAQSSSSVAVVRETITVRAGAITSTENNVYTLNRRTMQAVPDTRAFTYVPGNTPSRGASYYVTLPMGVSRTTTLPFWYAPSGTAYLLHPLAAVTAANPSTLDGLAVIWFAGSQPMTPAPAFERAALVAEGFPMSLTPTEAQAQLTAAGVPVNKLTLALLPVLTKSELTTLAGVLNKPTALQYFVFGSSQVAAEPRTGTIVKLQNLVDGVAVKANPAPLGTVVSILDRHLTVPGVPAAVAAIKRMEAAPPQPVTEARYTQTGASVASTVTIARNQIGTMNLATRDLPIGLGVLGVLLVCLSLFGVTVRRRRIAAALLGTPGAGSIRPAHDRSQAA